MKSCENCERLRRTLQEVMDALVAQGKAELDPNTGVVGFSNTLTRTISAITNAQKLLQELDPQ